MGHEDGCHRNAKALRSLEAEVAAFIRRHSLLSKGEQVLVGVSGGVDSVVLLHLLRRLGYGAEAAHVHHGLRPEADGDAAHVRSLCEAWDVPFHVARFDAKAEAEAARTSVQAAARELRYGFFDEVAAQRGIDAVAVAHHLDDQAETMLLNLFRGAGLDGLAAMAPKRSLSKETDVRLIRPLLGLRRTDVEAYARAEGLTWREDASNAAEAYRRSAVRHAILPAIEAHFGNIRPRTDRPHRRARPGLLGNGRPRGRARRTGVVAGGGGAADVWTWRTSKGCRTSGKTG